MTDDNIKPIPDFSELNTAELIKRIKENMHFSHDACRLFGNASDDNQDNNDKSLWLLEEAEQKMREVNQYLNELLKRVGNSNK